MEHKQGLARRASKFVAVFLLGAVTGGLALSGVMAPRAYLAALGQSMSTPALSTPAPSTPAPSTPAPSTPAPGSPPPGSPPPGSPAPTAPKTPRVGLMTYTYVDGQGNLFGNLDWASLLLITRLYNPELEIYTIVNSNTRLTQRTRLMEAFKAANVQVVPREPLQEAGTRYSRLHRGLEKVARQFAAHISCPNITRSDPEGFEKCVEKEVATPENSFGRFCVESDLANQQGLDYIVSSDADIVLLANLWQDMGHLIEQAQVLTLTEWSSQFVVFTRAGLDAFCNAIVAHTRLEYDQSKAVLEAGGAHGIDDIIGKKWCDMHFLVAFLRILRPDLPHSVLCGFPSQNHERMCPSLKYFLGVSAYRLVITLGKGANCLELLDEFVEWRPGANGSSLPELWARHTTFPELEGKPERVPLLHMQGQCKTLIPTLVRERFVQPGLIPDVSAPD